ncbi:uncharacterized protein AMSG_01836 [Thecamonas trahens ATCC 50062]|uniref:Glutaredoxin domain-containing protein n=1 Tax=Thecamonas trahens ATCC 50062 TaxID=461836 RepID=A0A0L0DTQ0_THETB|nr:hypothetical protein AMSG_01836 [Thecamonas trahens ATCC 50062]KNC55572.1 hypothetical protein AMSG_01836 [Thecamonas trahens ATCC 50062]|eukprot:XP_013761346.1 hypothetical protein AMSG_01836 [Thecamonas trahens ATCC 50062]
MLRAGFGLIALPIITSRAFTMSATLKTTPPITYEVSGFAACGFYQRAKTLVLKLEQEREDVKAKVIEFDSRSDYKTALPQLKENVVSDNDAHVSHTSSPLVVAVDNNDSTKRAFIGGASEFQAFVDEHQLL